MPIGAAIGIGSVASAGIGAYGANKAAKTQAEAAQSALNLQQQNLSPYLNTGKAATYSLASLMGLPGQDGTTKPPDYSSFYNSPDYAFAQQQGELGINRAANARGGGLGGGVLKDLTAFNSGLATQQYGNYYNRLMQLSNQGANAATGTASTLGNTTQAIGQANASGTVGVTNALTGGIGSGISNSLIANYLGKSPSAYASSPTYGGGNSLTDAYGGSSMAPLNGLSAADYGVGF